MMHRAYFVAGMVFAAGAALALRTPELNLRPMHGDEAVHAVKFDDLWKTGRYAYDPEEFHGPTLYYFTLPAVWLSGARDFTEASAATFRIVPVIFGVGLILLLALVSDGLGRTAAIVAAAFTAVSPALVFYSRYYIQETLLAFFALGLIGAGWRYARTRRIGWALLAGACAGLMHATKETCVIAFACMAIALVATLSWQKCTAASSSTSPKREQSVETSRVGASGCAVWCALIGALLVASVVSCLLYSGFLTNLSGPADAWRTYVVWAERAASTHLHDHPWYCYLHLLGFTHYAGGPVWSEAPILALAVVGLAAIMFRWGVSGASLPLLRFVLLYALLMTAAYSAIPYKTPWCLIQFLQPLTLLAGVGAAALLHALKSAPQRAATATALLIAVAWLARQTLSANLRFYADQRNPYVYAHPLTDVERLAAWVEKLAAVSPAGHNVLIQVIAPNPWPLPWYLRGFAHVGYWEQPPETCDAPILIVADQFDDAVAPRLHHDYQVANYGLRPGENLLVYARRDLYDAFAARASESATISSDTHP